MSNFTRPIGSRLSPLEFTKNIAAFFWDPERKRGVCEAELTVNKTGDKLQQPVGPLETDHAAGHIPENFLIIEFTVIEQILLLSA